MNLRRLVVAAPLALAFALPAQEKPVTVEEAPQGPTPAERLESLKKEKARLEAEIRYAKERVQTANELLTKKLERSEPSYELIDAGKPAIAQPVRPQQIARKYARVGTEEEMSLGGEPQMIMVEGRGISQAWFDRVMDYLREYPTSGTDALRAQRAMFDMIRIEAVASQFEENGGEVQLAENLAPLTNGEKTFAAAAAEFGTLQGAKEDGAVVVSRNSIYGPFLEQVAFSTPAGGVSKPFRSPQGFVVLKVDSIEKGEEPAQDKVNCHAVQFSYTNEKAALQAAQFKVNSGQVQVLVRDEQVLEMLPALFKKPAPRKPPAELLQEQITGLEAKIAEYRATEGAEESELKNLETRLEMLKAQLAKVLEQGGDREVQGDAVPLKPVKKEGGN